MLYFIKSHANIISAVVLVLVLLAFAIYSYFGIILRKNDQAPTFEPFNDVMEISSDTDINSLTSRLSAFDKEDGDVSDSIIVQSVGNFNDDMTRDVVFAAFDSYNHASFFTAKIKYTDYRSPEFYLSEPLAIAYNSKANIIDMIGASCVLDGDLSNKIKIESELDLDIGVHPYTVSVENSAGDVSRLTLMVDVVEKKATSRDPAIILDEYIVYLKAKENFDLRSVISSVEANCRYTDTNPETGEQIEIVQAFTKDDVVIDDGGFDNSTAGTYYVKYEITNKLGKTATVYLTAVVY